MFKNVTITSLFTSLQVISYSNQLHFEVTVTSLGIFTEEETATVTVTDTATVTATATATATVTVTAM